MSAQGYWAAALTFITGAALSAVIVLAAWWNHPSVTFRPRLSSQLGWSLLAVLAAWLIGGSLAMLALTGNLA